MIYDFPMEMLRERPEATGHPEPNPVLSPQGNLAMRPIHSSILAVATILLVTAPALAESKVSQCKRMAINSHKIDKQLTSLVQQSGGDPLERIGRLLKILENGANQIRAARFADATLVGFQRREVVFYEQLHDDAVDVYSAVGRQDREAAQQAMQKLNTQQQESRALAQKFQQYCQP
jgi:hypothetical protein